jgi:hypothetical protein
VVSTKATHGTKLISADYLLGHRSGYVQPILEGVSFEVECLYEPLGCVVWAARYMGVLLAFNRERECFAATCARGFLAEGQVGH